MEKLYTEVGIKESQLEFKRCVGRDIIGIPSSYISTPDDNEPNTEYIWNPRAEYSLSKVSTQLVYQNPQQPIE